MIQIVAVAYVWRLAAWIQQAAERTETKLLELRQQVSDDAKDDSSL